MDQSEQTPAVEAEKPFQFELRTLFLIMFLFAAFCGFTCSFPFEWALIYWSACLLLTGIVLVCRRDRRRLGKQMIVVGIVLAALFSYFRESLADAKEASRRAACISNLKHVGSALHYYADVHGSFPPAYIADKSGKPMHSWRVLILQELGYQSLYDRYNFDEPWDGPNNSQLHDEIVRVYSCPSKQAGAKWADTSYVVVIGPGTAFPGKRGVKLSEFTDGTSNTITVVEVANSGIHWMEPRDLDITKLAPTGKPLARLGASSNHAIHVSAGFADGSVTPLNKEELTMEQLQAVLSRNGRDNTNFLNAY